MLPLVPWPHHDLRTHTSRATQHGPGTKPKKPTRGCDPDMLPGCEPWPDELVERYRREGYWRGETLAGLIDAWSADGERTALVAGHDVWSYRRLASRAGRLATGLG